MMAPRAKYARVRRRGVAVIEAVVVLPLLTLIVLGVSLLSWYIQCAQELNSAARQGARAAVYHENSNAEVIAVARQSVVNSMGLPADAVNVRISALNSNGTEQYQVMNLNKNEQGVPVRIRVSVDYERVGFAASILGLKGKQISSYAVMRRRK